MKRIIGVLVLSLFAPSLWAQTPALTQGEAMKKLDFLVGQWKGTGYIEFAPNQRRTFTETENVQSKLGGLVLLIEGLGKSGTSGSAADAVVHSALAVVAYDEQAKVFRWRAYRAERQSAQSVDSEAKVGDKSLEWGFKDPRGFTIRFTIKLDEKGQWFEIGEISPGGDTWQKFFEMTLQRVGPKPG